MMESPLHAFLMVRSDDGSWMTTVCQDLYTVIRAWKDREDLDRDVAILHVGFDCPSYSIFNTITPAYPGRMLLTAAAKYALPDLFVASAEPVALTEYTKVFIGLQGWGYSIEDPTAQKDDSEVVDITKLSSQKQQDWITSFLKKNPSDIKTFEEHRICDDTSYLIGESELEWGLRHRSGMFRTNYLVANDCEDPCELARFSPPWLAQQNLDNLYLTERVNNVFQTSGIKTVRDLSSWSCEKLLNLKNFGRKSLQETLQALTTGLEKGPLKTTTAVKTNQTTQLLPTDSLLTNLRRSFLSFSDRDRDILVRRLGFERPTETLQKIADDHELTRERIRQIEARTLRKWTCESSLNNILEEKIKQLLTERIVPLPMAEAETIDPWFEGMSSHQEFLKNLVQAICKNRIHIIDIDGIYYFSLIDQRIWNRAVSNAVKLLSSGPEQKWSENHTRSQVQSLLPDNAKEFRSALWDKLSPLCHFITGQNNSRILISYGRGAEQLVKMILAESDTPLHYTEIAERSKLKRGKGINPRRAQDAATNVAFLLARGTYGLAQHIPLNDERMSQIRTKAENIVCSQASNKQWHASEIFREVLEKLDSDFDGLDKYVLNVALLQSKVLKPLGRMTWVVSADGTDDQTRIDIRKAIIKILKDAGRPLSIDEIKERLTITRGVNEFFQIQPVAPLVRMRRAVWGIKDRDLPLSHEEQQELIEKLVEKLKAKQSAIYVSELHNILPLQGCPIDAFLSIVIQDKRLKIGEGHYVYLTEWETQDAKQSTAQYPQFLKARLPRLL